MAFLLNTEFDHHFNQPCIFTKQCRNLQKWGFIVFNWVNFHFYSVSTTPKKRQTSANSTSDTANTSAHTQSRNKISKDHIDLSVSLFPMHERRPQCVTLSNVHRATSSTFDFRRHLGTTRTAEKA